MKVQLGWLEIPQYHKRTKHIDIQYHFVRERFQLGEFAIESVRSELQKADIFTKALPRDKLNRMCEIIDMFNNENL